jgi:hypothetical protein
MAVADLGPTKEISPSLRRDDVTDMAMADLAPTEEISPSLRRDDVSNPLLPLDVVIFILAIVLLMIFGVYCS